MVRMVTTSYKSSNFSTKAYNFTFVIIPHFQVALKLLILKVFFSMLTSTFALIEPSNFSH